MTEEKLDEYIDVNLLPARRVAARALVLASLAQRAVIELVEDDPEVSETSRFDLLAWTRLYVSPALEPEDLSLLARPVGRLAAEELGTCLEAGEALATLHWCLSASVDRLPAPLQTASVADLLATLPAPWQDPEAFQRRSALRPETDIATERERVEVWVWRASFGPDASFDQATIEVIADVAREAVAAGLLPVADGDLAILAQPFGRLNEEQRAVVLTVATARLRALNWVCGFGASWHDTPTDIDSSTAC